jgi:hypothetical protein
MDIIRLSRADVLVTEAASSTSSCNTPTPQHAVQIACRLLGELASTHHLKVETNLSVCNEQAGYHARGGHKAKRIAEADA